MTKGELIHFLMPFDDDIQIVVLGEDSQPHDAMLMPSRARYEIANRANSFADLTHESVGLTPGDGFIVVGVDR